MISNSISRRSILQKSLAIAASLGVNSSPTFADDKKTNSAHKFTYCLNTSTIMEQNLGLMAEMEIAAKAGYNGIEIWMSTLKTFIDKGGKLKDVKQKASDLGINIEDAIGFAKWIVDDPNEREKALEQLKSEMGMLAEIGCKRIAAPPFGATTIPGLNLKQAAERFKKIGDLGHTIGVMPQLEMWGFSANLHEFGHVLYVAAESGHEKACILADVYHLFKGGSSLTGLDFLSGNHIEIFHMNDYPTGLTKEKINDSDRIYPGDGIAPITQIIKTLHNKNTAIVLSLELFNRDYWKQDAFSVAKTGLEKMKAVVEKSLG
jgi:2-keto-myo-inositol isomerase